MIRVPPSFSFSGDKRAATLLKSQAYQFYNYIANQAELGGISHCNRSIPLEDGSIIDVVTYLNGSYGFRTGTIKVYTPPQGKPVKSILPTTIGYSDTASLTTLSLNTLIYTVNNNGVSKDKPLLTHNVGNNYWFTSDGKDVLSWDESYIYYHGLKQNIGFTILTGSILSITIDTGTKLATSFILLLIIFDNSTFITHLQKHTFTKSGISWNHAVDNSIPFTNTQFNAHFTVDSEIQPSSTFEFSSDLKYISVISIEPTWTYSGGPYGAIYDGTTKTNIHRVDLDLLPSSPTYTFGLSTIASTPILNWLSHHHQEMTSFGSSIYQSDCSLYPKNRFIDVPHLEGNFLYGYIGSYRGVSKIVINMLDGTEVTIPQPQFRETHLQHYTTADSYSLNLGKIAFNSAYYDLLVPVIGSTSYYISPAIGAHQTSYDFFDGATFHGVQFSEDLYTDFMTLSWEPSDPVFYPCTLRGRFLELTYLSTKRRYNSTALTKNIVLPTSETKNYIVSCMRFLYAGNNNMNTVVYEIDSVTKKANLIETINKDVRQPDGQNVKQNLTFSDPWTPVFYKYGQIAPTIKETLT